MSFFVLVKHQSSIEFSLVVTSTICERPLSLDLLTCFSSKPVLVGLKSPITRTRASVWSLRKDQRYTGYGYTTHNSQGHRMMLNGRKRPLG